MESQGNVSRFQFAWTEENIAAAKDGMEAGLSASQIGARLGVSRNTVIGKMRRIGVRSANGRGHQPGVPAPWKLIPKIKPNKQTVRAKPKWTQPPPIAAEEPMEVPFELPACTTTFDELPPNGCRWPSGDGPFLFCGDTQLDGYPYCAGHCSIAYHPTSRLTKELQYEVAA